MSDQLLGRTNPNGEVSNACGKKKKELKMAKVTYLFVKICPTTHLYSMFDSGLFLPQTCMCNVSVYPWTYYKWTLIVTLMNSCTCLCQKYHNDILNMPPRFDVMIVTVTFPG